MDTFFSNGDHGNVFMANNGMEALLRVLTIPMLPLSFCESPVAQSMAMVYRSLSGLNPVAVLRIVISCMSTQFGVLDNTKSWCDGFVTDEKCMYYLVLRRVVLHFFNSYR